jgi:hypothetical protein
MRFEMRKTAFLTAGAAAVLLAGCTDMREIAGLQKKSPDEFAVTTKAPLVIPPDFNLRPPMPGAPPANQVDPTTNAEQALFSTADPQTVANGMRGNYSMGEKLLLAHAGAQNADPGVRAKIAADSRTLQNANRSFTDRVLGASATADNGQPVNADKEVNRRGDKKTTAPAQKDSGGWFDWL